MSGERTPSVLNTCRNPKTESIRASGAKSEWTAKQRRHYQTIQTILCRWEHLGWSIAWVMLTTAAGGDARKLRVHLRELERRVEKKAGIRKIYHCVVDTTEGNGVLHLLWASPESLYVEQSWLSDEWLKIHGASYVWIKRYRRGTRGRLGRYMVSQYMAGQKGAGVRISWSWKSTFGIAIKAAWRVFKRHVGGSKRDLIRRWEAFLCDGAVGIAGTMASLHGWARDHSWRDLLRRAPRLAVVGEGHVCITRFQIGGQSYYTSSADNFLWHPC